MRYFAKTHTDYSFIIGKCGTIATEALRRRREAPGELKDISSVEMLLKIED